MTRRLGLFGAIALALALVYGIAWASEPGTGNAAATASAAPRVTAVTAVTRSCPPAPPGAGKASIALVSASPGPGQPAAPRAGSVTLSAVPPASPASASAGKSAAVTVTAPDTPVVLPAPGPARPAAAAGAGGATAIDASGKMAAGLAAEEATAGGMGTVSCAAPGADMWFVGTGQGAGASRIWLDLTNTGTVPASAGVTILTDSGAQDALSDGISVPAHRFTSVNLAPYVKGSSALAVQVQTTSGQVAAAVWEGGSGGGAWLPEAAAPSARLVIPGLPAGGTAKLFVAVPGSGDAQVTVAALTSRGESLPLGPEPQDAPAAAASSFPLSSLGVSAAALVLTANVPITAGVLVAGSGIGGFTAAAAPVTEQGVVAGNPSGGGSAVGLVLSAPGAAARVAVRVLPSGAGRSPFPRPRVYLVRARSTLAVAVSAPKGDHGPFAVVITPQPGSGPLYAAREVVSGGSGLIGELQSLLPVPSAPLTVALPAATNSYSAVLP
jgi:hypothetical protein